MIPDLPQPGHTPPGSRLAWIRMLRGDAGIRIGPDGAPVREVLVEGEAYCVPFGYATQAVRDGSAEMVDRLGRADVA